MAKSKTALPTTIYVHRETDGDDSYLVSNEDTASQDDGTEIGIYTLSAVKTMQVTRSLETRQLK